MKHTIIALMLAGLVGCATQPHQPASARDWTHADESRDNYLDNIACYRESGDKPKAASTSDALIGGVATTAWYLFLGSHGTLPSSSQREPTPEEAAANEAIAVKYRQCMQAKGYQPAR